MQRQALQRAWESDPAIAGFRGMADYDWDFNAADYGRLWPTDDVAKLLGEVLGFGRRGGAEPLEPIARRRSPSRPHAASRRARRRRRSRKQCRNADPEPTGTSSRLLHGGTAAPCRTFEEERSNVRELRRVAALMP